jgi:hypothetical protein
MDMPQETQRLVLQETQPSQLQADHSISWCYMVLGIITLQQIW